MVGRDFDAASPTVRKPMLLAVEFGVFDDLAATR
jgi:hypothetical protein